MKLLLLKTRKGLRRYDCDPEQLRVKHRVIVIFKQAAVIRQCHKPCHRPGIAIRLHGIPDRNPVIFREHSVDSDLVILLRELPFHQADRVDLLPVRVDAQPRTEICFLLNIKLVVKRYPVFLNFGFLRLIHFLFRNKMTVLDLILFKAVIICLYHASIRN